MNTISIILGIAPSDLEDDYVSVTCVENSVWFRIFSGNIYFARKFNEAQWTRIAVSNSKELATAVLKFGGTAFSNYSNAIELIVGSGLEQLNYDFEPDSVKLMYANSDVGCDEFPAEAELEGTLLVYRTTEYDASILPESKLGDKLDLPGFEDDPETESLVVVKCEAPKSKKKGKAKK